MLASKRRLGKIRAAILQPKSKIDECAKDIEAEIKTLHALKEAGHIAQAFDMTGMVSDTAQGLSNLLILFPMPQQAEAS